MDRFVVRVAKAQDTSAHKLLTEPTKPRKSSESNEELEKEGEGEEDGEVERCAVCRMARGTAGTRREQRRDPLGARARELHDDDRLGVDRRGGQRARRRRAAAPRVADEVVVLAVAEAGGHFPCPAAKKIAASVGGRGVKHTHARRAVKL